MDRKLIEYLPEFLRAFREFRFLTDKEQAQAKELWLALEKLWNNQYIETLDEDGCKRWETILKLRHPKDSSLKERRSGILSKMAEQRPFTMRTLKNTLTTLCGEGNFHVELLPADYALRIKVRVPAETTNRDALGLLRTVDRYVERVKPCNLTYESSLYDRHSGDAAAYCGAAVSLMKTYYVEVME
ncbi:MAG: DUF2313 domain-containing protein [Firmicutes bacterium]|jgi:hypothetical protein|nr:DUF2313 domain-containing protein [Bacillota bacterium]